MAVVLSFSVNALNLTDGMLGAYTFNDDTDNQYGILNNLGNTVGDPSHNSSGVNSYSYSFDGNDCFNTGTGGGYGTTKKNYTVSSWVYIDVQNADNNYFFSQYYNNNNNFLLFNAPQDNYVGMGVKYSGVWDYATYRNFNFTTEAWNHVVASAIGDNMTLWVNGVKANTTITTSNKWTIIGNMFVGCEATQYSTYFWEGGIDEVYIYERGLLDEEVEKLSSETCFYPFDNNCVPLDEPIVTVVNPVDNYHTNAQNVTFTTNISHTNNTKPVNCTFYVNDTSSDTLLNTLTTTKVWSDNTLTEGVYELKVSCDDGNTIINSTTQTLIVDRTNPLYYPTLPLGDNTSSFLREDGLEKDFSGYWNDLYMYGWNITIKDSVGNIKFVNETTNLTVEKAWVNHTVDMSSYQSGEFLLTVTGSDDHTAKYIKAMPYTTDSKGITYNTPTATVRVENNQGNIKSISTDKLDDRYTFSFEPNNNRKSWSFKLTSDEPINYRGKLYAFPSFVTGNQWVDFNTDEKVISYTVKKISDYEYDIDMEMTDNKKESLKLKSIGGLNVVTEEYEFTIVNNTAPTLTDVTLTDPLTRISSSASLSVKHQDIDSQLGTINYYWYVNGVSKFNDSDITANGSGTTEFSSLSNTYFTTGDIVNVTITVTDGYDSYRTSLTRTVIANDPPTILTRTPISDPTIILTTPLNFSVAVSEDDNDTLIYNWSVNGTEQYNDQSLFTLLTTDETGTLSVEVTVNDPDGNDTTSWTVTLTPLGYVGGYDSDDISPIAIDGVGRLGVLIVNFVVIIALVIMMGFIGKRIKKKR